jgi:hypothetical protein
VLRRISVDERDNLREDSFALCPIEVVTIDTDREILRRLIDNQATVQRATRVTLKSGKQHTFLETFTDLLTLINNGRIDVDAIN